MKKLYLLLLMSLLLFIPSTHAVTDYQLDRPIPELNGYTLREVFENRNMAMPDITGKTEILAGVYRIYSFGTTYYDYNVNTGMNTLYTPEGSGTAFRFQLPADTYTITVESNNTNQTFYLRANTSDIIYLNHVSGGQKVSYTINNLTDVYIIRYITDATTSFTLQIEKGLTATPYQKPTNGPYNNIDVGQFGLSPEQIGNYYNSYLVAIKYENVHDPTYTISTEFFLISTFFMYLLIMGVGYFTKSKYLYFAGAILWFVPIFNFTNIFVIITSVIVFISHLLIIFYNDKDDAFE